MSQERELQGSMESSTATEFQVRGVYLQKNTLGKQFKQKSRERLESGENLIKQFASRKLQSFKGINLPKLNAISEHKYSPYSTYARAPLPLTLSPFTLEHLVRLAALSNWTLELKTQTRELQIDICTSSPNNLSQTDREDAERGEKEGGRYRKIKGDIDSRQRVASYFQVASFFGYAFQIFIFCH